MFDLDPRDYDSRDDERHGNGTSRGALTIATGTTTGASPRFDRATGMTTMAGSSVVVRAVIGKPLTSRVCSATWM